MRLVCIFGACTCLQYSITVHAAMKCLAILLLVSGTAIVASGVPFRCVTPPAWEARVYEYESASSFRRYGRLYYDAVNERIAFYEEIFEGDEETAAYIDFNFFKQNMTYRYNTFTKQCSRRSMFNETFTRLGVSSTAEFLDTFIIGTNADEKFGVAVNLWGDNGGRNGRVVMEFVADDGDGDEDCIPISFSEFGGGPGASGFHHQSFYNVVIGVNPSHFILPDACQ